MSPATIEIAPGQSIAIVLGASWWLGIATDIRTSALPTPPCEGMISDVHRVAFPLASGRIEIDWAGSSLTWRHVCSAPPSITVQVETNRR